MKCGRCGCTLCKRDCKCAKYTRFFETLANLNRLHIINALRKQPRNVSQISETVQLEQSCVSHCLRKLSKAGFVTSLRDGKYNVYTLNKHTIRPLMQLIDTHVKEAGR